MVYTYISCYKLVPNMSSAYECWAVNWQQDFQHILKRGIASQRVDANLGLGVRTPPRGAKRQVVGNDQRRQRKPTPRRLLDVLESCPEEQEVEPAPLRTMHAVSIPLSVRLACLAISLRNAHNYYQIVEIVLDKHTFSVHE